MKCGRAVEPWQLTEDYARQFYEALKVNGWSEQALERLRAGGREYGWLGYLGRDNAGGGLEELLDVAHYAMFGTLDAWHEQEHGMSAEDAEAARAHLFAGARGLVEIMGHFEAARRLMPSARPSRPRKS